MEWRTLASVFAFVKELGEARREQCSVLSENYLALPLMFVKRTTEQNHKVDVDKVEAVDENEEADGTINVSLTMLTAITNWRAVS